MEYKYFINYLKSRNIILFDHDYRISYYNINNINNYTNNMTGGGLNILTNYNDEELATIINLSISEKSNYLYKLLI